MIIGTFALGCLIIAFGLIVMLHNAVGLFPFDIPYFGDETTIVVIGVALVALAFIFRIPVKK